MVSSGRLEMVTAIFGRSYQQLLPVFAKDVLDTDPAGLGFLMAAPGAGTLIAAVTLSAVGLAGRGWVLFASMFLFSGSLLAFSFSRSMPLSMLLLLFTGAATLSYGTTQATIMQLRVPGRLRGRVSSIMTMVMQGMPPVGALLIGTVGTAIGAPASEALANLKSTRLNSSHVSESRMPSSA